MCVCIYVVKLSFSFARFAKERDTVRIILPFSASRGTQFSISGRSGRPESSLQPKNERESRIIQSIRFLGRRAGAKGASYGTVGCTLSFRKKGR